jgi:hypothetical protein
VPGVLACNGSAANLSSSDAAGHRSGKGISVVKQLWAPNISTVRFNCRKSYSVCVGRGPWGGLCC